MGGDEDAPTASVRRGETCDYGGDIDCDHVPESADGHGCMERAFLV